MSQPALQLGSSDAVWRREYPFKSHYMNVGNDVRLHYVDEGPRVSQQTLLAVHGNPTWSFYYRSIYSNFATRTEFVAVDHVGCGGSDKPISYDDRLAKHTENLVD